MTGLEQWCLIFPSMQNNNKKSCVPPPKKGIQASSIKRYGMSSQLAASIRSVSHSLHKWHRRKKEPQDPSIFLGSPRKKWRASTQVKKRMSSKAQTHDSSSHKHTFSLCFLTGMGKQLSLDEALLPCSARSALKLPR